MALGAKYVLGSSWFGAATTMTIGDDEKPTGLQMLTGMNGVEHSGAYQWVLEFLFL